MTLEGLPAAARPDPLRVDLLPAELTAPGRLGLTLLPGRRDRGRELEADVEELVAARVATVICLVEAFELGVYGVPGLFEAYARRGLTLHHVPLRDGSAGGVEAVERAVAAAEAALARGETVLLHCAGGLGRAGMIAACVLRGRGLSPEAAIAAVRLVRGPRAIETLSQEARIAAHPARLAGGGPGG